MFNVLVIRAYIALERLWWHVSALLRSKTAEANIPDYILTNLAQAFLVDIIEFFAVEENQADYNRWKNQREKATMKTTEKA